MSPNTQRSRQYVSGHTVVRDRKKKRKNRQMLLFGLLLLATLVVFIVLSMTVFFNVQQIEVAIEGDTARYTYDEIRQASEIEVNENMWRMNLDKIADKIDKKLYYLTDVKLSRKIPSTIVITASEARPAGLIEVQGSYAVIASSGKVMEIISDPGQISAPVISGISISSCTLGEKIVFESEVVLARFEEVSSLLIAHDYMKEVSAMDFSDPYETKFTYLDGRFEVWLGENTQLEYKLECLAPIIAELSPQESGIIDLSNPSQMSFRPKN